ncbi:MAG: Flp pilus assembly protein CpaB [Thermomicrobium sp.]|nr:Flp pilus assembly protein CpaB [Thermomicrobium sp.]
MLRSARLLLVTGAVLAVVAVVLAMIAVQRSRAPTTIVPTATPSVPVVVAARDIRAGTVLRSEDLRVIEADPSSVAPGTVQQPDQAIGLVVAGDIVAGQRLLMANLVAPSVSNLVTPGKRAVAIPVDRINAIGGLIQQNDLIDVVYAGRIDLTRILPTQPMEMSDSGQGYSSPPEAVTLPSPPGSSSVYPYPGSPGSRVVITDTGEGQPVAKIVLQNLRVLQVVAGTTVVGPSTTQLTAERTSATRDGTATPTPEGGLPPVDLLIVEADPSQAELITFLLDQNVRYQVVLRARGDTETVRTDGVTYDRLVRDGSLPVPAPVQVTGGTR